MVKEVNNPFASNRADAKRITKDSKDSKSKPVNVAGIKQSLSSLKGLLTMRAVQQQGLPSQINPDESKGNNQAYSQQDIGTAIKKAFEVFDKAIVIKISQDKPEKKVQEEQTEIAREEETEETVKKEETAKTAKPTATQTSTTKKPAHTKPVVTPDDKRHQNDSSYVYFLDNILKNPKRVLGKIATYFRFGPVSLKDMMFKALSEVAGVQITEQRKKAVMEFLQHLDENKSADVDGDGDTDMLDLMKVWQEGRFYTPVVVTREDKHVHDPLLPHVDDYVHEEDDGHDHGHSTHGDHSHRLGEILEDVTGQESTIAREAALQRFFNNPYDADGDGDIDISDIIKVWSETN